MPKLRNNAALVEESTKLVVREGLLVIYTHIHSRQRAVRDLHWNLDDVTQIRSPLARHLHCEVQTPQRRSLRHGRAVRTRLAHESGHLKSTAHYSRRWLLLAKVADLPTSAPVTSTAEHPDSAQVPGLR